MKKIAHGTARTPHPPHSPRRFWERWTTRLAVVTAACALLGGVVYVNFHSAPGYAPWQDKASTLLRNIGLGGPLDGFENWFYSRQTPSDTPPDVLGLLAAGNVPAAATYRDLHLPKLTRTADGAGWHPMARAPGDRPMVYTALLQPDPRHRSIVAGVALIRSAGVEAHLVAGTAEPPATGSAGRIPAEQLPDVVAAFNSGFKMGAHPGGFFLDGNTIGDLEDGKASIVIDDRGAMTVGQWGRDVYMNTHVRAVRQNLALIVEGGRPVAGLDRNVDMRWGTARNQLQYTWRSGLGTTAHGDVVYLAGNRLNLATLGEAMAQAGIITGMELDIHSGLQFFSTWQSDGGEQPRPKKLLSAMIGPSERYVEPDIRDFFYFSTPRAAGN